MKLTATTNQYTSLYKYLAVLDEEQIHKLHKVAAGMLDISAFSAPEIEQLQRRLSTTGIVTPIIQIIKN